MSPHCRMLRSGEVEQGCRVMIHDDIEHADGSISTCEGLKKSLRKMS